MNSTKSNELWSAPKLHTDEEEGKHFRVTWLELFFDLVFVGAVAELSHLLVGHADSDHLFSFIFLFIPLWWVWIGSTYYNERFQNNDISDRLLMLIQMIPVAALAVFIHGATNETAVGFALSYVLARSVIIFNWLRGGYHNPIARPVTNRYVIGFTISISLWTLSILFQPPIMFIFWIIGLLIDLITPLFTFKLQAEKLPRISTSHLPERFGLFTILVLGESVLGVIAGMSNNDNLTPIVIISAVFGLVLAFMLWWLYFDQVAGRRPKYGTWWPARWVYSHLALVISITAIGAGILNVIAESELTLHLENSLLLSGAVASALIFIGFIEWTRGPDSDGTTYEHISQVRFISSGIALMIGVLSYILNSALLLLVLLSILLLALNILSIVKRGRLGSI
ncbi:MAG: low temperature requirement protein A [Candidatus Hermodarchaeota archaeon]